MARLGHGGRTPWVTHLRTDGFASARIARWTGWWVVCDMVEKPSRVATLMANWLIGDHARHAMFNLKLPMKNVRKRWKAR